MMRRVIVCLALLVGVSDYRALAISVQPIGRVISAGDASTVAYQRAHANGYEGTGPVTVIARTGTSWTRASFTPTGQCSFVSAALSRVLIDCPDGETDASGDYTQAERPWFFDPATGQ